MSGDIEAGPGPVCPHQKVMERTAKWHLADYALPRLQCMVAGGRITRMFAQVMIPIIKKVTE